VLLLQRLRKLGVDVPVIGFPRGAGAAVSVYVEQTGVDAVGLDTSQSGSLLPEAMPVQGNLDPQLLVAGGEALERGVEEVRRRFSTAPHVFNLGHGITPDAKIENVARMIDLVKGR
jgi:uroporphyrinogen decarboxylase